MTESYARFQVLDAYLNQPEIVEYQMTDLDWVEMQALEAASRGELPSEVIDPPQPMTEEPTQKGSSMRSKLLLLLLLLGLALIAMGCGLPLIDLSSLAAEQEAGVTTTSQPAKKAGTPTTPIASPTPAPTATPTINRAELTLEAGQLELLNLAIQGTAISQQIIVGQATQAWSLTETAAVADRAATAAVRSTAAASTLIADAQKTTSAQKTALIEIAQATERAAATRTPAAATAAAIAKQIKDDDLDSQFFQSLIPVRRGWADVGQPILLVVVPLGFFVWVAARFWLSQERRLYAALTPVPATNETYDPSAVLSAANREPRPPYSRPIEVHTNNGRNINRFNLPATDDQLIALAQRVLAGEGMTHTNFAEGETKLFTRTEFTRLQYSLEGHTLAFWVSPAANNKGCAPTAAGILYFEELVGQAVTHQSAFNNHQLPPPSPIAAPPSAQTA